MSEEPESRDSENNWVIPNTEGLPVETVGAAESETLHGQGEVTSAAFDPVTISHSEEKDVSASVQNVKEPQFLPPLAGTPTHQEQLDIPPGEPESTAEDRGQPLSKESPGFTSRAGVDLEEVSCSSSDDDVEGLRKRVGRGAPPVGVGPTVREAEQQDADAASSLTLNRCIIAALALVGIGLLIFSGSGFSTEDDAPQTVLTRSVTEADQAPEGIADIQEWIQKHADQFSGDPGSLQVMSGLLDKVAKENQDIRHMQAKLQAQKEELEALLQAGNGEMVTSEPQHLVVTEENVKLKDALLKEETAHLSAKEELQDLQVKLEALEASSLEKEVLVQENSQLKVDLDFSKRQIEGFLVQKETLVAESQMLRQELDKQRLLLASIRQDLENLTVNNTEGQEENILRKKISDMSNKLVMETQRSETWEKKYVEHAQKRKEQIGEEKRDHSHKEWKRLEKLGKASNISISAGESKKTHFKHGRRQPEEGQRESQHEEWKSKKYEEKQEQHWRDKKHRHWEGEKGGEERLEEREQGPHESESWRDKGKDHKSRDSAHHHHENSGISWKEKQAHHQGEAGNRYHPRKGQKEFSEAHKHVEENNAKREHGKKTHGKETAHRHHDHNKFWKKLSDHQYRVPEGCSGLEDCARKDGIDLFNVELSPVQRKKFEEVLQNYLEKTQLSKHLPELVPLLDGFFEGPLFSHHKIRFKDFVDDVEDFLEDLAKKETGDDDIVDDFERYVYINFFGEAATKKRFAKKTDKPIHHNKPGKLEKSLEFGLKQAGSRHSAETEASKDDLDVDFHDFKLYKGKSKMSKTHKQRSPNHQYEEESEPGLNSHKHDKEESHSYKAHHKPARRDTDEDSDSFNQQRMSNWRHSEKKPKYNMPNGKDGEHRYKSYQEHHVRKEDDGHFHKHKPHNKHHEQEAWQDHRYHKDRFHIEDDGHQPKYSKQKSTETHGKDGHGHGYKYKPSNKHNEEDTVSSFQKEHKHYQQKHDKDATNKHHRSSQPHFEKHGGHHHDYKSSDHKPWKEGDHRPREPQPSHKNHERPSHYTSKSNHHKNEGDENRHKFYENEHHRKV
ncbi:pre-B-cell leukemia transcription factor-interacting protein 1 isoform X2 [Mixophyes fleayi]|uniref:pre-B-cell leukemia transcription factor-interacting protein 1 isoform X2 n=1 Tax=Mixophyes fleayi TaxID=3061075 RepID=UPI003F4DABB4